MQGVMPCSSVPFSSGSGGSWGLGDGADHLPVIPALRSSSPRVREVPGAVQGGCRESLDPKDGLQPWATAGIVFPSKDPCTPPDFTLLASFALPARPWLSSGVDGSVRGEQGAAEPTQPGTGSRTGRLTERLNLQLIKRPVVFWLHVPDWHLMNVTEPSVLRKRR